MNGSTALVYARSRHGNNGQGSDFARSRRQQQIIVALKAQIESIGGIGKLPDLIDALGNNVLTNLTISDAESLYGLVQGVNPASIEHIRAGKLRALAVTTASRSEALPDGLRCIWHGLYPRGIGYVAGSPDSVLYCEKN